MKLVYPWVLMLIPLALWWARRGLENAALTVPSLGRWPQPLAGRTRFLWLPILLRRLALILILVALARPQGTSDYGVDRAEGIAIQMLVDVSSSMDMNLDDKGGHPSTRMEVAKEMVAHFIAGDGEKLKGRPEDLIGLITFARYADTRSPLTLGHDALLQIVSHLTIQDRPNEDGTAYGDALAIAAARLRNPEELMYGPNAEDEGKIKSRVIVLLTDGENNSGTHLPLEAAGLAKQWGCRIYAISLGDAASPTAVATEGGSLSPAEKLLEHISTETGGVFRQAHDFESLSSVYAEIDRLERSEIKTRSYERVAEWFPLPLALALAALAIALTLEATWLRVVP